MAPLHNNHSSRTLQLPKSPIIKKEELEKDQAAEMITKIPAAPKKNGAAKTREEEQQPQPQPKRQKKQKKQPQPKKQKKQKKETKLESRSPLLTPSSASAPENFSRRSSSSSPEVEVVPRPEPVKSKDQEPSVGRSVVPVKGSGDDTSRELKYPAALLKYRKTLQLRSSPKREATLQKWLPLANRLMAAHVEKLAKLRAELEAAAAAPMESCESREKEEVEVAAAGAGRASCCPHHEVEASEDDSDDDDDDSDSDDEDWWPGKDLGWSRDEGMEHRDGQPVYGDGY
ncbi:uncharacterized protein B0T23DRAFT_326769 [Neurospora hispaniola]|uniref:Uncharacterized protein n=1 Tax=Neurospora hispaniola TaxID=588809 RepID=A0AAJ0HZ22_9PEZI|nr:hypothetical protein B0T23DRAFT_326769 [Neurospora hispaniola]